MTLREELKLYREELHQIPELAFDLYLTHAYIKEKLESWGYLVDVMAKTGIVAVKHGKINEMIGFYLQKYPDGSEFMVRKSLTYFDDADNEVAPILFHDISWSEIKKTILLSIDEE
jgi:hypothetical protein